MPARRPLPEDAAERLKTAMKKAKTKDEYRRVLCVWLRHVLGLNSTQIAAALLWSPTQVREVQSRFLRQGEAAFAPEPGRGGRRRWLLTLEEESKVLRRVREEAWPSSTLEFHTVQQAVEKAVGRSVDAALVHRMLKRHGWGRRATVFIPRHQYPAHMPTAVDSPGKDKPRRTGVWQLLVEDPVEWKPVLQKIQAAQRQGPGFRNQDRADSASGSPTPKPAVATADQGPGVTEPEPGAPGTPH